MNERRTNHWFATVMDIHGHLPRAAYGAPMVALTSRTSKRSSATQTSTWTRSVESSMAQWVWEELLVQLLVQENAWLFKTNHVSFFMWMIWWKPVKFQRHFVWTLCRVAHVDGVRCHQETNPGGTKPVVAAVPFRYQLQRATSPGYWPYLLSRHCPKPAIWQRLWVASFWTSSLTSSCFNL